MLCNFIALVWFQDSCKRLFPLTAVFTKREQVFFLGVGGGWSRTKRENIELQINSDISPVCWKQEVTVLYHVYHTNLIDYYGDNAVFICRLSFFFLICCNWSAQNTSANSHLNYSILYIAVHSSSEAEICLTMFSLYLSISLFIATLYICFLLYR